MSYSIYKVLLNKEISIDPGNPYSYKYKKLALAKMQARIIFGSENNPLLSRVIVKDSKTKKTVFKIDKFGEK